MHFKKTVERSDFTMYELGDELLTLYEHKSDGHWSMAMFGCWCPGSWVTRDQALAAAKDDLLEGLRERVEEAQRDLAGAVAFYERGVV